MDGPPSPLLTSLLQNKLFIVRGVCIVDVLADLKVMEDMVSSLEETIVDGALNNPGWASLISAAIDRFDISVRLFCRTCRGSG